VYKWANTLHLIPSHGGDIEGGFSTIPGSARAEAERRRAMALQALDQRLSHTNSPSMSGPLSAGPVSAIPRLPPAVASPRPEKVASPAINQKNSLETDDGDIGIADADR